MRSIALLIAVGMVLPAIVALPAAGSSTEDPVPGVGLLPPADHEFTYRPGALADDPSLAGSGADVPDSLARDTSDYMIGTGVVHIVFLESDGSDEPESEDWTSSRKSKVLSESRNGLNFWESEAPGGRYDVKIVSSTVNTGVEPIRHPGPTGNECDNQFVWIHDAMNALGTDPGDLECQGDGWDSSTFSAVRSYAHDLRNAHDRDWGYVAFVVDSKNDGDGKFSDGWFAYAYRGGPFTVLTWDNDGWGIDRFDRVMAHESGHIFGATDEYDNGDSSEEWGYLWVQEVHLSGCIMDDASWCVSSGTAGQIGWRDSDGDGLVDPVDTRPDVDALALGTPGAATNDPTLAFDGVARDIPYPAHDNYKAYGFHDISINDVTTVEWSVDGGGTSSTGTDVVDPQEAPWSFETSQLSDGDHTIEINAVNEVGGRDAVPVVHDVKIDSTGPTVDIVDPQPGRIYYAGFTSTTNPADPGGNDPPVIVGNILYAKATASDPTSDVAWVDFYVDGQKVGRDSFAPYETRVFVDHLPATTHTLEVVASDDAGNTASTTQTYRAAP